MDENNVNALSQDSVVESQPTTNQSDVTQSTSSETKVETSENNSVVAEPKQPQSKEENKAFAEMRRQLEQQKAEAEAIKRDYEIARQYGQYGIFNQADYDAALAKQQAEELGISPELHKKYTQMEQELNALKQEKEKISQEESLAKDPVKGEFFNKYKDDIKNNANQFNCDLETAFLLTIGSKLSDFKQPSVDEIKQQAVKEYIEKLKTTKPVEAGGSTPAIVNETPKTFEEARKQSISFLRNAKLF